MELRHLQYLVAVVEEASFTRAAARVHVAQPGVSAQIRQLEAELGQPLLDRSGKTVTPTQAGEAVLPYARAALAAASEATNAVQELAGLLRGQVTIGTVTSISSDSFDLPALLARFHHEYPDVEITLTAAGSDQLIKALHEGRLDIAFLGLGASPPPGLSSHLIAEEPLVAAVCHAHPLATRTTITLATLAANPLISLPRGSGLRSSLDSALAAAGLTAKVSFEAGDPRILAQLAAHDLGVAVVPRSITDARAEQLHALRIIKPALRGRIALAWRTGPHTNPAARKLIHRVRAASAHTSKSH